MAAATNEFHAMRTYNEKVGAYRMLSLISDLLQTLTMRLDSKTILRTLDAIQLNLLEDLIHSEIPQVAPVSPPLPPLSPTAL
jgi:hypothetical protein